MCQIQISIRQKQTHKWVWFSMHHEMRVHACSWFPSTLIGIKWTLSIIVFNLNVWVQSIFHATFFKWSNWWTSYCCLDRTKLFVSDKLIKISFPSWANEKNVQIMFYFLSILYESISCCWQSVEHTIQLIGGAAHLLSSRFSRHMFAWVRLLSLPNSRASNELHVLDKLMWRIDTVNNNGKFVISATSLVSLPKFSSSWW